MTDAMQRAMTAATQLDVDADDEEGLYRLLGMRMKALERDPSIAGQFAPAPIAPAELGITVPDLLEFGRATFVRIAAVGQSLVCGTEANQGFYLQRLLTTLGTDTATVTAAVATLLIAQLAIAPAVAGVVATIIVGKVAPTSLGALCKMWGAKVGARHPRRPPVAPQTRPRSRRRTRPPSRRRTRRRPDTRPAQTRGVVAELTPGWLVRRPRRVLA